MEFTKLIKRILAGTVCISVLSGFTGKEEFVELRGMLNGRSSSSFTREDRNILTTLTRGTRGEILETKKLRSGSFGIKIKVMNGKNAGKEMWVYHKDGDSDLALYETIPANWSTAKTTRDVTTAQAVAAKRDKAAIEDDSNSKTKKAAKQKTAAGREVVSSISKINKTQGKPSCTYCSSSTNEGRGNILRPAPSADDEIAPSCYKIMNRQGNVSDKGQYLMDLMARPNYIGKFTKRNALGDICPKFNSLSDKDKLVAWTWMWTALGHEESGCNMNLNHPTTVVKKVKVRSKSGKMVTRSVKRVINRRAGYGIWTMESDAAIRARRGPECKNIKTYEGQAMCAVEIMTDNQLSRGDNATDGDQMYWGPLIRYDRQMVTHMQRLKLCY